jgi:putative pyruvate formate lyase activating enzyme
MRCVFCQNFPISQLHDFPEVSDDRLAEMFLELQDKGAHNINLVTGTHFLPSIASSLLIAKERGLRLPVVWNSSGYERAEIVRLMEPFVDVYLPDLKYAEEGPGRELSDAKDYPDNAMSAIREMYRQKGLLRTKDGIAVSGLVVRHLVLPGRLAQSKRVLEWLAREISTDLTVSLMSQYFPAWKAVDTPGLERGLTVEEYEEITDFALSLGLENALIQDMDAPGNC